MSPGEQIEHMAREAAREAAAKIERETTGERLGRQFGPAFPNTILSGTTALDNGFDTHGLTKLESVAATLFAGMLANPFRANEPHGELLNDALVAAKMLLATTKNK